MQVEINQYGERCGINEPSPKPEYPIYDEFTTYYDIPESLYNRFAENEKEFEKIQAELQQIINMKEIRKV